MISATVGGRGRGACAGGQWGLSLLVQLLMLITSLALLARSRAWVVFRWVGVAAPAQRRVRGIAQRITAGIPDRFRVGRGCRATARALAHLGSESGLRGLIDMAVPSPPRVPEPPAEPSSTRPARPLSWHAIFFR